MLAFETLREANLQRLPTFKNRAGEPAHSTQDGSDWDLSAWFTATAGEEGEMAEALLDFVVANRINRSLGLAGDLIKKLNRKEVGLDDIREKLAKEMADVVTYLDILAYRCDINLAQAVYTKFNQVSDRVGSPIKIAIDNRGGIVYDLRNEENNFPA